jgi:hypothetical protein
MTTNSDVTIAEMIEVARQKRALLTPETAGYVVLEATSQAVTSPVLIDEHLCTAQADGGRVTMLSRRVAHPLDAERGLRQLLRRLLEVSSGRAPALHNVAQLPPRGDLAGLRGELESALIPLNRGAASRALSRLARETIRARRPSYAPDDAPPPYAEPASAARPMLPSDDTEPMEVGVEALAPFDPRDSQETLNRQVDPREPSLPRFALESSGETPGRASDAEGFVEEATTARREVIPDPRSPFPSADNVDQLLDDLFPGDAPLLASPPAPPVVAPPAPPAVHRPPSPPPPVAARAATPRPAAVLPPPTPPPPVAARATPAPGSVRAREDAPRERVDPVEHRSPTPPPAALPPVAAPSQVAEAPPSSPASPAEKTPRPPAAAESARAVPASARAVRPSPLPNGDPVYSSYPPSARGVDELLQDFLGKTSRKQNRVAEDLRKMAGVEAVDDDPKETSESPFSHASGATDFYTSTPPPRAASSASPQISHIDLPVPAPKRGGMYAVLTVVSLVALGGVALFYFEPGFLSGRTPTVVAEEHRAAAVAASAIAAHPPQACRATLIVTDVPQGAEVLVRSGLAPVDVERVPSGARLEFVALSDGFAPRRGVVPQGASWDSPGGKPRFELPIQLEKSKAKSGATDPWPPAEPGTVVGGQGAPGTVHVVTSPRGAEVWMVAGGGPEAKIEALPCGNAMELLIAGTQQDKPTRRRLHVEASRLTPEPSGNTVTGRISAK